MKESAYNNQYYKKIIGVTLYILIFSMLASCSPDKGSTKAPDFDLVKLDGKSIRLSNFSGKAVLVNFWATYCPPCIKEIPMFQTFYNKYKTKNFVIIGISTDRNSDIATKFIKKMGVTYPVGMATKKIVKDYKVHGLPTSYLVDISGKIIQQYIGPPSEEILERDIQRALGLSG